MCWMFKKGSGVGPGSMVGVGGEEMYVPSSTRRWLWRGILGMEIVKVVGLELVEDEDEEYGVGW